MEGQQQQGPQANVVRMVGNGILEVGGPEAPAVHARPHQDGDDPYARESLELDTDERQWAAAIKRSIEVHPELDQISDYDCSQWALVEMDDTREAVERALKLQVFKQEYDITDTVGQGRQMVKECMDFFPGYYLSFSFFPQLNQFVLILDVTKLDRDTLNRNPRAVKAWLVSFYYILHALCHDFQSIVRGAVMFVECQGFHWRENINLERWRKFWEELGCCYPILLKTAKHFHTSLFMNLMMSMGRPFIPEDHKEKFELGGVSPLGRLDEVCLQPSLEAANERFLSRFEHCLQQRCENSKIFKL